MKAGSFLCPVHGHEIARAVGAGCSDCISACMAPIPATPAERAAELRQWMGMVLTVPFERLHKRIEQLAGRSVWTHELAHPEDIAKEIEAGATVDPEQTALDSLTRHYPDKPVIKVRTS